MSTTTDRSVALMYAASAAVRRRLLHPASAVDRAPTSAGSPVPARAETFAPLSGLEIRKLSVAGSVLVLKCTSINE